VSALRSVGLDSGSQGMKYLRMQQEVAGLEVHGAYLKAAINARVSWCT